MTKNNKTQTPSTDAKSFTVPAPIMMIASLVEVVASFLAAYLLLRNFEHVAAQAAGWFFLVQASLIVVVVFVKAFKK
jgi:choline-glycine betaine transporter